MEGAPEVIIFSKVNISKLKEDLSPDGGQILNTEMRVSTTFKMLTFSFPEADTLQLEVRGVRGIYRTGPSSVIAKDPQGNVFIQFSAPVDCNKLMSLIEKWCPGDNWESSFDRRTDTTSAQRYWETYSSLAQQQVMLQDYPRTSTYQKAFLQNKPDFVGKVVLDVGAGTGILSLFCAQAGAAKVYAVEASNMASYCKTLVASNNLDNIITVVEGKIEEIILPDKVDMIVSEPMGYLLFNERMIESYLYARRFLKPGGKMFPTEGNIFIAPFMDDTLYLEQMMKVNFWSKTSFHGVDLSSLHEKAGEEYLSQPVKGNFDEHILLAKPTEIKFDFLTAKESDLEQIVMPVHFEMVSTGTIHGLAFWFDVHFIGSVCTVVLSTSPSEPLTHWYQIRCLLKQPLPVEVGTVVTGTVIFKANNRQSYDLDVQITNTHTSQTLANVFNLKKACKRCLSAPPTSSNGSSVDDYVQPGGIDW